MNESTEVTVLGGGVIGLAVAWELAKNGYQVRAVEANRWGSGSSWAGAGILPPAANDYLAASEPIDQLRSLSHKLYPEWTHSIREASKIDPEFRRCGGIYLARTPGERATLTAQEYHWDDLSIEYQRLDISQLGSQFPEHQPLANRLAATSPQTVAWYLPDECTVRNPRLIQGLVTACRSSGVELVEGCTVHAIHPLEDKARLESSLGTWTSQHVCLCTGAWAQLLLQTFEVQTGILPVRGQMLLYKFNRPPFATIVNDGHRYLVPRLDGHVLAGSCEEEVGFDATTTNDRIDELKEWVDSLMPDWNPGHFVKAWAGLRPGSFDGLPYIGRLPTHPSILVAAGHFRSGLHLAPITAQIVRDLVEGSKPPLDISPFHLNRGRMWLGVSQR